MEEENVIVNVTQKGQAIAIATTSDAQSKKIDNDVGQSKADVWKYFKCQKDKGTAVCNICKTVLKAVGGCTSGLISHAKSQHDINILKRKCISEKSTASQSKKRITEFFKEKKDKDKLEVVLSRMVALDGLSFRVFTTSGDLRNALKADGYDVPKSPNTIRKIVMQFAEKTRNEAKNDINQLTQQCDRFCISHDEWTSMKTRRYLNIILHHKKSRIWNLGLIRVKGSMKAEIIVDKIEGRPKDFGISLDRNIICQMTDGCKTMVKVGKVSTTEQQLCYAHGVQLAVLDVLYEKSKKQSKKSRSSEKDSNSDDENEEADDQGDDEEADDQDDDEEADEDDDDEEADEDDDDEEADEDDDDEEADEDDDIGEDDLFTFVDEYEDGFEIIVEKREVPQIRQEYKAVICKVRKIVKKFKRSTIKNDVLQSNVTADGELKQGAQLSLDCKTRSSSLVDMLARFHDIRKPVKKALVDVGKGLDIDEEEQNVVKEIVNALKPVRAAVEALCRRDANLLTADAILSFTMNQLQQQNTKLSMDLFNSLQTRILERRTNLSGILKYLHTGSFSSNDDSMEEGVNLSAEVLDIFDIPNRKTVESSMLGLLLRLEGDGEGRLDELPQEAAQPEEADVCHSEKNTKRSRSILHQELDLAIAKALSSKVDNEKTNSKANLLKLIKQEMKLLEAGGNRGRYLSKVYEHLLVVKPTSIESERAFSSCTYLCPKIKGRMNDQTLDNLLFLRTFFQEKKKEM